MVSNSNDWEQLTIIRLNEANNKLKDAQNTLEKAQHAIEHWQKYVKALENVLELAKHPISGQSSSEVEQMLMGSTWDNLKTIMNGNKGGLKVQDAVSFLVHVKFFDDREHARNVIYSTLNAHSNDVQKISPGVYRLIEAGEMKPLIKDNAIRKHSANKRIRKPNLHLKEKLVSLRNMYPNLTRDEALNILLGEGFDFQGKFPKKVLAMAWVGLGYAKKKEQPPTQQALTITP